MYKLVQIDDNGCSFTIGLFETLDAAHKSLIWHESQPLHPLCKQVSYRMIEVTK
jgi:hypothetical protein